MADKHHIDAGPELNIVHAAELRQGWMDQLPAAPDPVELDLSGVQEMDSAGVQLLIALHKELTQRGQALSLTRPSRVVREVLETFGLNQRLPLVTHP